MPDTQVGGELAGPVGARIEPNELAEKRAVGAVGELGAEGVGERDPWASVAWLPVQDFGEVDALTCPAYVVEVSVVGEDATGAGARRRALEAVSFGKARGCELVEAVGLKGRSRFVVRRR